MSHSVHDRSGHSVHHGSSNSHRSSNSHAVADSAVSSNKTMSSHKTMSSYKTMSSNKTTSSQQSGGSRGGSGQGRDTKEGLHDCSGGMQDSSGPHCLFLAIFMSWAFLATKGQSAAVAAQYMLSGQQNQLASGQHPAGHEVSSGPHWRSLSFAFKPLVRATRAKIATKTFILSRL